MACTPPPGVRIVPRKEAVRHADLQDLVRAIVGFAIWVPQERYGGPGAGVLVVEFGARGEEVPDDWNGPDEEGVV